MRSLGVCLTFRKVLDKKKEAIFLARRRNNFFWRDSVRKALKKCRAAHDSHRRGPVGGDPAPPRRHQRQPSRRGGGGRGEAHREDPGGGQVGRALELHGVSDTHIIIQASTKYGCLKKSPTCSNAMSFVSVIPL